MALSGVPPVLEFEGVWASYGGPPVLEEISFSFAPGEFTAIVGPSGSGKTTLLSLVCGRHKPDRGSIRLARPPGSSDPAPQRRGRARLGYVPQIETVDWSFPVTAEEVVLMGRAGESGPWPWARRSDRAAARELLDRLGIGDLHRRHIRDLSGGQQQRVFLARALMREPDLLLLDEPTSGIDVATRHDILHLLHELNERGIAIVLTTHDLNAVAAHMPRVICLNRRLIADGTPHDALNPGALRLTFGADMEVLRHGGMTVVLDPPPSAGETRGRRAG